MRTTAGRVLEEVVADIYLMGAKPNNRLQLKHVANHHCIRRSTLAYPSACTSIDIPAAAAAAAFNISSHQVMRTTAGRVLEEVVADIYLMGAKPVGEYEAERVEACIKDLQLDRGVAMDVIKDVTKQR
jgi:hypothetical protein